MNNRNIVYNVRLLLNNRQLCIMHSGLFFMRSFSSSLFLFDYGTRVQRQWFITLLFAVASEPLDVLISDVMTFWRYYKIKWSTSQCNHKKMVQRISREKLRFSLFRSNNQMRIVNGHLNAGWCVWSVGYAVSPIYSNIVSLLHCSIKKNK